MAFADVDAAIKAVEGHSRGWGLAMAHIAGQSRPEERALATSITRRYVDERGAWCGFSFGHSLGFDSLGYARNNLRWEEDLLRSARADLEWLLELLPARLDPVQSIPAQLAPAASGPDSAGPGR